MCLHGEDLHRHICLLTQAYTLIAHTPIQIVPSSTLPWRYTVKITGFGPEYDQECGIEDLAHVVRDALNVSGYPLRLEESFIDRVLDEYSRRQDERVRQREGIMAQPATDHLV